MGFRVKLKIDRTLDKCKTRLIAKGFLQMIGIDFFKTFLPVVKLIIIRVVLILPLPKGWKLRQIDVNITFLNEDLIEDMFMV